MNYIGSKVIYLEQAQHECIHVAIVDGDCVSVTDGGMLIVDGDPPSGWGFVSRNYSPSIEVGVHHGDNPALPTIYPNCKGASSLSTQK